MLGALGLFAIEDRGRIFVEFYEEEQNEATRQAVLDLLNEALAELSVECFFKPCFTKGVWQKDVYHLLWAKMVRIPESIDPIITECQLS